MQGYIRYLPEPEERIIRCGPWIVDAISNSTMSSIGRFLEVSPSVSFKSEAQDLIRVVKISFEGLIARSIESEKMYNKLHRTEAQAMCIVRLYGNEQLLMHMNRFCEPKLKSWPDPSSILSVTTTIAHNVIDVLKLAIMTILERTEEGMKHAPPPILSVNTD